MDVTCDQSIREEVEKKMKSLSLKEIIQIPGTKSVMLLFFCYCALEQTAGLWASSYMVLYKGILAETAASYASLFYLGITIGRAISGFITMKLSDRNMIRLGLGIIAVGIAVLLIPTSMEVVSLIGLMLVGLGCAPVYPCVIHSTPDYFGADKKIVERKFKMIDGTNSLKIVATSMDDSVATFNGNATK